MRNKMRKTETVSPVFLKLDSRVIARVIHDLNGDGKYEPPSVYALSSSTDFPFKVT